MHRFVLACALVSSLAHAADAGLVTTVIVVRHAEKAAEPKLDPPLTPAGEARAAALVKAVGPRLDAVLSTDFARTRNTGAPAAAKFKLSVQTVGGGAPEFAKEVLEKHRGQTVLIVGHSNTVPAIVTALGAAKPKDICETEFDDLFVVTVPASGTATVEQKKYGAKTPCPP
ncbi:MAG: histidine phosphatase family protein [Archangiaceae bacterium]|nr:histidine phosphatase family protein [Archangiaceae bacterium]